ncbi:MAG TPA: CHAT domain-containing protein [Thermoanaerobaculia bacterium]|nr:CHAT domain-containing protein [Thermoanaerobaculia bacterium]
MPAPSRSVNLRATRAAFLLLPVIAVIVVIVVYSKGAREPVPGLRRLASTIDGRPYRRVEARLAGGFAFKPYSRTSADPDTSAAIALPETPDRHTTGVLLLLNGRMDAAIEVLERAARDGERTASAELLANLAAARYERGAREGRALDLAEAFSAAARAIEVAPTQAEARYTRALALEALNLREDAGDAWREYLAVDGTSEWAAEARRHLQRLGEREAVTKDIVRAAAMNGRSEELRRLAAHAPSIVRITAEDQLLGEWADAILARDPNKSVILLAAAREAGDALVRQGGDRTVADAVAQITAADDVARRALADAHRAYAEARRAFDMRRDAKAREALLVAAEVSERVHSPLAARAFVYAGTVASYEGSPDEARRLAEMAATRIDGRDRDWPVVAGQAHWLLGQLDLARGLPHQAAAHYEAAREHFHRAGERSNVSGVETMLAACFHYLGDEETAWAHYLESLRFLDETAPYNRRQIAFADAAKAATEAGHLRLAELLTARVAARAKERGDAIFAAQSLYAQARILTARRRFAEAASLLERASATLDTQPPTASTTRLVGDIASARGEALLQSDPREALRFLNVSLERHRRHGDRFRLPEVHLLAAFAHEAVGDLQSAERELRAGIEEIERQRLYLRTDEERSTFTDTARRLYDGLVNVLVEHGATDEALRIVRGARTIGITSPGSLISTRAHSRKRVPPPDSALIDYYVLPDRLLVWTTTGPRTAFQSHSIATAELERKVSASVERLRDCMRVSDCRDVTGDLFDLLLRPAMDMIRGHDALVIAPDGILHSVPFAALFDRGSGTFVVETYVLRIALADADPVAASTYRSIFVATAPEAAGQTLLPHATAEARRAAGTFETATVVEGADATADRVLSDAPRHEVVHFAGHARWNERQPRFAALLLAPSENRPDGSLYAYEMSGIRFDKTKLVVLAGCDTARGRRTGVGLLSFARTFAAAGVPRVVGSLWPVDDEASASLFAEFYPELARGSTPERALAHAQRAFLRSRAANGPAGWAMFQVYSGYETNGGSK